MKINNIRRISQILVLVLFVFGNLGFIKVLTGDLSSSKLFEAIPFSDPFAFLQIFLASATLGAMATLGAIFIFLFYALVAPRVFCSWICPVNLITDFAYFIRVRFKYSTDRKILNLPKNLRYYILIFALILSYILATPAFENISWIGFLQRGIIFFDASVIGVILCIFVFDAFLCERGICSRICPVGAFYSLVGKFSLIRIKHNVKNCQKCMDCKLVCPENQVLDMVGKRDDYVGSECISCGKCLDICAHDAFEFSIRNLRRIK